MRRLGLRARLVMALVALSVVSAVLVAVTSVVLTRQAMLERATSEAVADARVDLLTAARAVRAFAVPVEGEEGLRRWRVLDPAALSRLTDQLSLPDGTSLLIVQRGGSNHSVSDGPLAMDEVPAALQSRVREGLLAHIRTESIDGGPLLVVGGRVAIDALEMYRIVDLSPIEADLALVARRSAYATAIPIVLALLVGIGVARQVLRPIGRARDAARRIADGHLDVRVPTAGGDELAELGSDFNAMASSLQSTIEDLQELMGQQRRFVADVAHELRSPLTALTAAVEVLEQEEGADTADRREAMRLVVDDVRALRLMVEDLMEVSRFDAGASVLDAHQIGLRTVVEGALRRRRFASQVGVEIPADLRVVADPRRLDAIVGNLVGNALTHGRPPVRVVATVTGDGLDLDVIDAGPGVPAELRESVFDRFVKADAARTRAGGSGLGLAIARENALLHGGQVTLEHSGPDGSVFRCHLPAARIVVPELWKAAP